MPCRTVLPAKSVVIIIEGIPVPLYRKVWDTAIALHTHGAEVSVICPRTMGFDRSYERLDGIDIYRHPMREGTSSVGFLLEYSWSLFWEFWLLLKVWRRRGIDVIHGCSPPDIVFLAALPFKLLGVMYVHDHHDLNPELYVAKFGKGGLLHGLLRLFERASFLAADYSIAPNLSYRNIAIGRGRMNPGRVAVVRSCPNLGRLRVGPGNDEHKRGKRYLVGYVGVVEKQDRLDSLMEVIRIISNRRDDVHFAILGDGTELQNVRALARRSAICDAVTFYGMVTDESLFNEILNSCDVCANPDWGSDYADCSTPIKIMEYMALGKPIVQFDLREARALAQDASLYADSGNLQEFAGRVLELLDDSALREDMGARGYARIHGDMSWEIEQGKLIALYRRVFVA